MLCVSTPVGSKKGGVGLGVGVAHCVPHPPGQASGQWYTSCVSHSGGVQVTTGVLVGASSFEAGVEGVGVCLGFNGTVGDASLLAMGGTCATGGDPDAVLVAASSVMTMGCDWPSTPWASKALTTMTCVPGTLLCQGCDTMYGEFTSGLESTRRSVSSIQSSAR